jgi:hypothetical protein
MKTGWQKGAIIGGILGVVIGLIIAKMSGMILTVNTLQIEAFKMVMIYCTALFAVIGGLIGDTASKINGSMLKQNPFKMIAPWGIGILFAFFAGTFQICFESCGPGGIELLIERFSTNPGAILTAFGIGFLIGWIVPNILRRRR